jgi:hypothetical protein
MQGSGIVKHRSHSAIELCYQHVIRFFTNSQDTFPQSQSALVCRQLNWDQRSNAGGLSIFHHKLTKHKVTNWACFYSSFTDQRIVFGIVFTIAFENCRNKVTQSWHAFFVAICAHPLKSMVKSNNWLINIELPTCLSQSTIVKNKWYQICLINAIWKRSKI